jgi:hypothetical protein
MTTPIVLDPNAFVGNDMNPQIHAQGLQQGAIVESPYADTGLRQGIVNTAEPLPLFAGMPIKVDVRNGNNTNMISKSVSGDLAAVISGFSTSHKSGMQTYKWQGSQGGANLQGKGINYFLLGSQVEMDLKIDPTYAATLLTTTLTSAVTLKWDYTNNQLAQWVSGTDAANLQLPLKLTAVFLAGDGVGKYQNSALVQDGTTGAVNWDRTATVALARVTL